MYALHLLIFLSSFGKMSELALHTNLGADVLNKTPREM